ncbi:hypothetical protein HYH02_008491 [Chlamydomonas schloesseri]|uniref:FHA domain-containing protein n=1 Tax=Chlamydomonas schloesseri TaxID=2026947 RepID=A0A835WFI9_9CHLO|nr:hypothetical protein HYH02_008491 [Chlamydomonas schloesseri]|eukprot:KAG2446500.1 hypothetical protein HYH02_008491 [Chlamydomonas schloesseri]
MDRWIDADDDTQCAKRKAPVHGVAAGGLAAFVKSGNTIGTDGAQAFGKIEIVASKRERKAAELKAEAARLMPPPRLPGAGAPAAGGPPVESIPAAEGPPKCPVPSWAGEPPAACRLLVYKDGAVIQDITLGKVVTVFGRVPELADVVLDHPSISRQHATAAWHPGRGVWLLTDLGSTHGTWVGEQRLAKNEPTELRPGVELRFAASTRRYKLAPLGGGVKVAVAAVSGGDPAAASGSGSGARSGLMPPPPPKRPRVSFADDEAAAVAASGNGGGGGPRAALETVIGFTDGKDFVRVGPRAAAPEEGRFAAAVPSTTVVRIVKPGRDGGGGGSSSAGAGTGAGAGAGPAPGAAAEVAAGDGGGGAMAPPPPRKAPGSPRPGCGRGASLTRAASGGGGGGSSADEDEEKAAEEAGAAGRVQGGASTGEGGVGQRASGPDMTSGVTERRGSGGTGGAAAAGADEVRPQLRDFVDRLRKAPPKVGGGDSLYAALPPPSR